MADTDLYYNTGTVAVTNGSATVTGTGTLWQGDPDHPTLMEGDELVVISAGGDLTTYVIGAVSSDTSLTLTRNYAGTTGSGRSYIIHKVSPFRQETPRLLEWVRDLIGDINNLTAVVTYENVASAVNFWKLTSAAAAGVVLLSAVGSDTNISTRIASKGTGSQYFQVNGADMLTLGTSGLKFEHNSAGGGGAATPRGLTLSDLSTGGSWDTAKPFLSIDFSSADTTTLGAGVRFRIGTRMTNAGGGATAFGIWGAPTTAGTLSEYFTMLNATGAATFANTLTASAFIPSGSSVPSNGFYLPAANTLGLAVNSALEVQLTASALSPGTNDGSALGTTALGWADLHLASGGVINWANGEVTLTETSADLLTLAGGRLSITDSTASTSTTTGALTVTGGIGVGGAIYAGGAVLAGNGDATAPGISFVSDPDTGMYRLSSNALGFTTGGTVALVIDSGNRLLKGSTSNIPVGAASASLQVHGTNASTSAITNVMWFSGGFAGPASWLAKSRGASVGSFAAVQSGDILGQVRFCGDDGTDLSTIAAELRAVVDGTVGTGNIPTRFEIRTMPSGGSLATRLTVYSTGIGRISSEWQVGGDVGGAASHITFTNTSDTAARSTGVGTIKFDDSTNRDSAGFIKIYVGTTAYYVPIFSAI